MKVILSQDVKKRGKKGDIVEVQEGYGRNFLLPKKVAIEATANNINVAKAQANASYAAVEKIQERQAVQVNGQSRPQHACAEKACCHEAAFLGPDFLRKTAQKASRHAQKQNGNGEHPGNLLQPRPHLCHHGLGEHTPRIDTANGNMDANGR